METIQIFFNGRSKNIPRYATLEELVWNEWGTKELVVVEINGQAYHRDQWPGLRFNDGDRLEVVRLVCGG